MNRYDDTLLVNFFMYVQKGLLQPNNLFSVSHIGIVYSMICCKKCLVAMLCCCLAAWLVASGFTSDQHCPCGQRCQACRLSRRSCQPRSQSKRLCCSFAAQPAMPRVPRNESSAERPARGRAGRTTMRRVGGTAAGQQKPHAATTHQVEEGQNRRGHRALSAVLCQRHGRTRAGESLRGRFAGGRDAAVLELVRHGRAAQPRSRPVPLNRAHDKRYAISGHTKCPR